MLSSYWAPLTLSLQSSHRQQPSPRTQFPAPFWLASSCSSFGSRFKQHFFREPCPRSPRPKEVLAPSIFHTTCSSLSAFLKRHHTQNFVSRGCASWWNITLRWQGHICLIHSWVSRTSSINTWWINDTPNWDVLPIHIYWCREATNEYQQPRNQQSSSKPLTQKSQFPHVQVTSQELLTHNK